MMRIIVFDYSGHYPQADLAEKLAAQGHSVLHLRCGNYITGNPNFVNRKFEDGGIATFVTLITSTVKNRYSPIHRIRHEYELFLLARKEIRRFKADLLIMSNVPIASGWLLTINLRLLGIPYVYWWQDIYYLGIIENIEKLKYKSILRPFSIFVERLERSQVAEAKAVIAISEAFRHKYVEWNLDLGKFHSYSNWSPPEAFASLNYVTCDMQLPSKFFLYAGTLGMKHNPTLLVQIADHFLIKHSDFQLVVISNGVGREFLEKTENRRKNLILLDFVPMNEFVYILNKAYAVIGILEQSAGRFSVPSKVMTYLCAGKAILAAIPEDNLASEFVRQSNSGYVVNPEDILGALAAVDRLIDDTEKKNEFEVNARTFAKERFSGTDAADFFMNSFFIK